MQKTQSLKNKRNLLFHKSREPCPTPALFTARGFVYHARTLVLISVLPSVFLYEFLSKEVPLAVYDNKRSQRYSFDLRQSKMLTS